MEPPPAVPPVTAAPPSSTQLSYAVAESVESSPRSRNADSWDDHLPAAPGAAAKLRLMCSYGGHIVPRPHDKSLCYVGGDTRIVVVERHSSLADLTAKLSKTLLGGHGFTLKYQLPNEDLDSLISVTTDEDLENMVDEYDRTSSLASHKPSRLRLFLFASKPDSGSASSIGSLLDNSTKTEDWFLNALNGSGVLSRGVGGGSAFSDSQSYTCLLGLDDDAAAGSGADAAARAGSTESGKVAVAVKAAGQDVHSVPDSPMLETTSSFGSASSSPLLANLPPIRVHVEDAAGGGGVRFQEQKVVGIEEQLSQMTVTAAAAASAVVTQKQDEGFVMLSPPPPIPTSIVPGATAAGSAPVSNEYSNRVFSDEERSEHRTQQQPPPQQPQPQFVQVAVPKQSQQRLPPGGGMELPSPDSVSSDGSFTNAMSRPKPTIYADPVGQLPSSGFPTRVSANPSDPNINVFDPNPRGQMLQQLPDPGYVLTQAQYEQHQHQQQPQVQAQPQQYIHPGTHYVHHQVQPTGPVQIPSYYPVYPSQHQPQHHHPQLDQQYPFFFVPARPPAQPYNLSMQSKLSESGSTNPSNAPSNPAIVNPSAAYSQTRTAPPPKPEMAASGIYRTSAGNAGGSHLVQLPSGQHQQQYVGYSQIHHPSQSIAPNSGAATANYAYEYADPNHAQIYYSQALPPQYQTITSTPGMMLSDATSQLPADSVKQQVRSSQPL